MMDQAIPDSPIGPGTASYSLTHACPRVGTAT